MPRRKKPEDYDCRKIMNRAGSGIENPLEPPLWQLYERVLGMDEAGRGPLCGPVVVAGVIFPKNYKNHMLNDSKKLSEKTREALFPVVVQDALAYQIRIIPESVIDEKNIYRAVQDAMEDIARSLQPEWTLSDAMPLPNIPCSEAIIKGDSKSLSIAAASILAKVTRDHYMEALDQLYPQYGLARHKGYPTVAHLEAIRQYGVQDFYRRSFRPVMEALQRAESEPAQQMSLFDSSKTEEDSSTEPAE